jgi:hypothetical protein
VKVEIIDLTSSNVIAIHSLGFSTTEAPETSLSFPKGNYKIRITEVGPSVIYLEYILIKYPQASIIYDNLNEIEVSGGDSGAEIKWYNSNNGGVIACGTNVTSLDPNVNITYHAVIKGSSNYVLKTNQLNVNDVVPLYQYPPIGGTTSSLTTSTSASTNSTWTISGATHGNGEYNVSSNVASNAPGGSKPASPYGLFDNAISSEGTNYSSNYGWWQGQYQRTAHIAVTTILPSAITVRKYILWPADTGLSGIQAPGSSTDPTLPSNSGQDSLRRPRSWILLGSDDGTSWTTLHSVNNQVPSIDGDIHTISSPGTYSRYRLDFLGNNGSTEFMQLGEVQFWGDIPLTGGTFSDSWTVGDMDTYVPYGTSYTLPTYTTSDNIILTTSDTVDTSNTGTYSLTWSSPLNNLGIIKRISRNIIIM